ncbi:DUF411 domain-containing protein [Bradyrhizobium sp. 190]|uniref:DUF411 domain-containing protein n=1 Tax=Bradyrhizobium sp. 190 TaxID=2782658 RepID=UPI001FF79F0E|nr:DUF411 domain-containing protein [Bradyrhizobium sp. 190]MCK1513795.1 DUF411 domain-containing protein [Bradyrhizobium sp. 190]
MQRLLIALLVAALGLTPAAAEQLKATLFKQPYCGCCDGHADHLRQNRYDVTVQQTENLSSIKKRYRVPQQFKGCHTTIIGGYVVEGHVPASIVHRLLKERPAVRGISLPGMPDGSPGMTGGKKEPFVIYSFGDDGAKVYARE